MSLSIDFSSGVFDLFTGVKVDSGAWDFTSGVVDLFTILKDGLGAGAIGVEGDCFTVFPWLSGVISG